MTDAESSDTNLPDHVTQNSSGNETPVPETGKPGTGNPGSDAGQSGSGVGAEPIELVPHKRGLFTLPKIRRSEHK